jgi:FMN phosphatase YigB (HAD superfamily)
VTRSRNRYLVLSPDVLAAREGGWPGVLADTLSRNAADVRADAADLEPHLSGFPWERPGEMHADWPGDRWWGQHEPVFAAAFAGAGVPRRRADALAERVRGAYRDTDRWRVHPDAAATLTAVRERGWTPLLLGNGPPDLPEVLGDLGLSFSQTFVSATTGYELPHPRAWETVYDWAGDGRFWAACADADRECEAAWDAGVPVVQITDAPGGTTGEWDRTATLAEVPDLLPD